MFSHMVDCWSSFVGKPVAHFQEFLCINSNQIAVCNFLQSANLTLEISSDVKRKMVLIWTSQSWLALCCRDQATDIELSKVRGVWRLQAPQRWRKYIQTCRAMAPALSPLHPLLRPWKLLINVRSWLTTRNQGLVSSIATAPATVAGASASAAPAHQATQSAEGATARAGSIEMVSPPALQLPAHRAAADLAVALNEQWMWHGTSCQVNFMPSARPGCSDSCSRLVFLTHPSVI